MICQDCRNSGLRSRVYIQDSFYDLQVSQDRFFDEDGRWHVHDENETKTTYKCTRGHSWYDVKYAICWCQKQE